MTIRWKLNVSVAVLLAVFFAAVGFVLHTVNRNAEHTQNYSRMRARSQFVADLRTDLHQRLASAGGFLKLPPEPEHVGWPGYALADIDFQTRLANTESEKRQWRAVRESVQAVAQSLTSSRGGPEVQEAVRLFQRHTRALRHRFDLQEHDSIATVAWSTFSAQVAITVAFLLTIVLFWIYLGMVRRWLVTPIDVLKGSADAIGEGDLGHRVPLKGTDELAQLARRIDAMASSLAQQQKELLEARELSAIGELCTNVAHGLRNPLAGIRASAQLALKRTPGSEQLQTMIRGLMSEVDRMDLRIVKLFEFSKPKKVFRECLRFAELADAVRAETQPLMQPGDVRLTVIDETEEATLCLDREQICSAVVELASNAVHHSPPGSEVTLRGAVVGSHNGEGEHIQIQVIDRGAGMEAVTAKKAFDLFFTGRPGGTGMGLAMVRRTVQRHDGKVTLSSEPGRGTTVTVTMPGLCPLPDDDCLRAACNARQQNLRLRAQVV